MSEASFNDQFRKIDYERLERWKSQWQEHRDDYVTAQQRKAS